MSEKNRDITKHFRFDSSKDWYEYKWRSYPKKRWNFAFGLMDDIKGHEGMGIEVLEDSIKLVWKGT